MELSYNVELQQQQQGIETSLVQDCGLMKSGGPWPEDAGEGEWMDDEVQRHWRQAAPARIPWQGCRQR